MNLARSTAARQPQTGNASEASHRIPVIDKMMTILEKIEASDDGVNINALTASSGVSRSTVYRILKTLNSHGMVSRGVDGNFKLGLRLVSMAAKVKISVPLDALIDMVHPKLVDLAQTTGETCKLSVLRDGQVEAVDVVIGTNAMTPASRVGNLFPIHAGAASKALLAFCDSDTRERLLLLPKDSFTPITLTKTEQLRTEFSAIRAAGVSYDRGEWNANVHAVAAPILGIDGLAVAAISVIFFAREIGSRIEDEVAGPLLVATRELGTQLGFRPARQRLDTGEN